MKKIILFLPIICLFLSCKKNINDENPIPKPNVEDTLTSEMIQEYFGFDKSKTVEIALGQLKNTGIEKIIASKKVLISEVEVLAVDAKLGVLKIKVLGEVNDNPST